MKLICYIKEGEHVNIQPAGMSRHWMDQSVDRFAYRCLPLNIANSHGWEILSEASFEATWNGGSTPQDITIIQRSEGRPAISHFGSGVLTFHVPCVFRTENNWNLMVMGPPNCPKRGIQALTGVIETDWSPYSFTMNWIFTEPNHTIKFEKDEPFCFFFPIPQSAIHAAQPSFCNMKKDPLLYEQHHAWVESRYDFIKNLAKPGSSAQQEKWQRKYFHGQYVDGQQGTDNHQVKCRAKPFAVDT